MDRHRLREQYEKTGDLMDVFQDHDVLREMVAVEEQCGDIGAGFSAYTDNSQPVDQEKLSQVMYKVRLQSILFTELRKMMNQANLGAGTEAAIEEARIRIHYKLANLTIEQQSFFDALIAEELSTSFNKPIRAQLPAKICSLLSVADWHEISQAVTNAVQAKLVEFIESAKSA